jgi:hypothetical protein
MRHILSIRGGSTGEFSPLGVWWNWNRNSADLHAIMSITAPALRPAR